MAIVVVVADVDGTLLGPGHLVDDAAKAAVKAAHERGAVFTIATGRIFHSARAVALEAGIGAPIIAGGGAVLGYPEGGVIRRLNIGREMALEILCRTGRGVARYAFVNDRIYTDTPGPHVATYSSALGVPVQVVGDLTAVVNDETTHVVLRLPPSEADDVVGRFSGELRGVARVMRTLPHLVEFVHPLVSKGRAIEYLCTHLGVPLSGVLAVGDGLSDTDMLAVAGVGVAVANAPLEVRRRSRHVTRESYAAGVLEAIREFVGAG